MLDSLRAATANGARVLGVEADLGTVEKGKLADLIAVRGDPLQDARSLEAVELVVLAGIVRKAAEYRLTPAVLS